MDISFATWAVLGGLMLVIRATRPSGSSAGAPLTAEEKAKLDEILAAKDR